MNNPRRSATWIGAALGSICAVLLLAAGAHADSYGSFREEFHKTYPISDDGRVSLSNINGPVHISTWDRNEVKVDAIKTAGTKEQLDAAHIEVNAGNDHVEIETKYNKHDLNFYNDDSHDNPASVEYTLTVPRTVRLDDVKLINGSLDVSGVEGEVRASCINGKLEAENLAGPSHLSTINGLLEARFAALPSSRVELNSVNGELELTIPSDSKANIDASTVSGTIDNDFGLHENKHHYVGRDLRGELGGGGTDIELKNVNGRIDVRHANDGKAMSPAKDLDRDTAQDDDSEL